MIIHMIKADSSYVMRFYQAKDNKNIANNI